MAHLIPGQSTRHDIIHRSSMDLRFPKEGIQEVLDLVLVLIDTFVDHLESTRGKGIRDCGTRRGRERTHPPAAVSAY